MGRPMRIAIVGNFYPDVFRVAPVTTGLTYLLSTSPRIEHISVFCPFGSILPEIIPRDRVELRPSWSPDNLRKLTSCALRLARESPAYDAVLFNIYLTSFGRSYLANGIGLITPVLVRRLSGRPPLVYMHNFLETEDASKLGYEVGWLERTVVRKLEAALLNHTKVVVPLATQKSTIEKAFDVEVPHLVIPYVEGILSVAGRGHEESPVESARGSNRTRVLLFGAWGPQKDLEGALRLLRDVSALRPLDVTVAGGVNPNFPEYAGILARLESEYGGPHCRFLGRVSEDRVPHLFATTDCLVLPYRAMGGYSGVLSTCALFDVPVIAYRVPGMREFAEALGQPIEFVDPGDAPEFSRAVDKLAAAGTRDVGRSASQAVSKVETARVATNRLIDLLEETPARG